MKKYLLFFIALTTLPLLYCEPDVDALIEKLKTANNQQKTVICEKIIARGQAAVPALHNLAKENVNLKHQAHSLLSQIQKQWQGNGKGIFWQKNLSSSIAEAQKSKKLILFLHTTGKLSENFC